MGETKNSLEVPFSHDPEIIHDYLEIDKRLFQDY